MIENLAWYLAIGTGSATIILAIPDNLSDKEAMVLAIFVILLWPLAFCVLLAYILGRKILGKNLRQRRGWS